MIELQPPLFTWLLYSAADLRNLNQTVELLREIKAFFDRMSETVGDALNLYKDQLFVVVTESVDGLQAATKSPLTDPAVQQRLEKLSEGVMTIINERTSSISSTKKANKKLKGLLDELSEENETLRGKTLPGTTTPPRRPRRGRR
jgi:hypothetical protein